jgi:hypothetical protein
MKEGTPKCPPSCVKPPLRHVLLSMFSFVLAYFPPHSPFSTMPPYHASSPPHAMRIMKWLVACTSALESVLGYATSHVRDYLFKLILFLGDLAPLTHTHHTPHTHTHTHTLYTHIYILYIHTCMSLAVLHVCMFQLPSSTWNVSFHNP